MIVVKEDYIQTLTEEGINDLTAEARKKVQEKKVQIDNFKTDIAAVDNKCFNNLMEKYGVALNSTKHLYLKSFIDTCINTLKGSEQDAKITCAFLNLVCSNYRTDKDSQSNITISDDFKIDTVKSISETISEYKTLIEAIYNNTSNHTTLNGAIKSLEVLSNRLRSEIMDENKISQGAGMQDVTLYNQTAVANERLNGLNLLKQAPTQDEMKFKEAFLQKIKSNEGEKDKVNQIINQYIEVLQEPDETKQREGFFELMKTIKNDYTLDPGTKRNILLAILDTQITNVFKDKQSTLIANIIQGDTNLNIFGNLKLNLELASRTVPITPVISMLPPPVLPTYVPTWQKSLEEFVSKFQTTASRIDTNNLTGCGCGGLLAIIKSIFSCLFDRPATISSGVVGNRQIN
jgi:hypothetical protein